MNSKSLQDQLDESDSVIIPVVEEQVQIGKEVVETGAVRIAKRVIEESKMVEVPTVREDILVERVAVNKYVDTPPATRQEGETTIIPVVREVVVTEKKLLLVEEVRVTKRRITEVSAQEVTLRKEEVTVERNDLTNERPA